MFVSLIEGPNESSAISIGTASASPVTPTRRAARPRSRLGVTRTELLTVLGEHMSIIDVEKAVCLIGDASKSLTCGQRFDGWRRALDDRELRLATVTAMRANPLLRRALLHSKEKPVIDAVRAMRIGGIGVELVAKNLRARTHHLGRAQKHTSDLRLGECLADILPAEDQAKSDIAIVRSRRRTASFAIDMALIALGESIVSESRALNVRLGQVSDDGPMADARSAVALKRVLHTLCIEEPRVGEGIRHQLAKSHVSPSYLALMSKLDLQWSLDGWLESKATPVLSQGEGQVLNFA